MDVQVQRRLLEINRSFYDRFARQFADSRSTGQASLQRALAMIAGAASVLDVGCGDGRVARALDKMGRRVSYTGVDASEPFITLARERSAGLAHVTAGFQIADVAQDGWARVLPAQSYGAVLALAVLHHLPGRDLRRRLVSDMAALLAPSGTLVISTWQFLAGEKTRKKIIPWAMVGLDDGQVDAGDFLLDWERGGYGLRYCALIGEDELRALCRDAGLRVTGVFAADNGLNLYAVAKRE